VIPGAFITEWRSSAPWLSDAQVEHDLILSRTLVELFSRPLIAEQVAFRGGTALHKVFLPPAVRFSEDVDLVQSQPGPIGPLLDSVRGALDGFLGIPQRKIGPTCATLTYRVDSEGPPIVPLRFKVEINTREHSGFDGFRRQPFAVTSRWFTGSALLTTYTLEELMATKLRALYQRRKGRDLFDLWMVLSSTSAEPSRIIKLFQKYMVMEGHSISCAEFLANMEAKLAHGRFLGDVDPQIRAGVLYDPQVAYTLVTRELLHRL
jgi:predicted nucleotidyltransferase component of viral defense system